MRRKEKIELAVTSILILVLVILVVNFRKMPKMARVPKAKAALPAVTSAAGGGMLAAGSGDAFSALEEEADKLAVKRDPFTGAGVTFSEGTPSGPLLTGIIWDKEAPMAIINDEIVKTGDEFGKYRVVDIKEDRVILNDGTKDQKILLEP